VENWYYAHGGTINSEDCTLDHPPSLREAALEILKTIEDVKAGRVRVDKEMDEFTMAVPEEQRAIERVQVDNQRYTVDDIFRRTTCELHKQFGNIKMKVCIIHAFISSITNTYILL
jgi:hypothetical protein